MNKDNIWEQIAIRYDTEERIKIAGIISTEVQKNLTDTKDKILLDYGCGTGLVGLTFAKEFREVIFADFSDQMLSIVKEKIKTEGLENAHTLRCDLMAQAQSDLKADCLIASQVLLHISDTEVILSKLYETINPHGQLIVVDFDKNEAVSSEKVHNGFVKEEMIGLAKQTGFKNAEAYTFYRGKKMFMNQDASLFLLKAVK